VKRDVHLVRDLPFAPREVWRALTDRALLAQWLMDNDFAAEVGHRFQLKTEPAPGFDGTVHAEVLELVACERMVWRWRGGPIDTTLTFRLEPRVVFAREGTRLRLDHEGFGGVPAVLVSFILGAGWRRMLRRRLPAALDGGESPAGHAQRGLWYWLARSFAPVLSVVHGRAGSARKWKRPRG
jgi:uncharacterized protein YndB with AHSA1/START domain